MYGTFFNVITLKKRQIFMFLTITAPCLYSKEEIRRVIAHKYKYTLKYLSVSFMNGFITISVAPLPLLDSELGTVFVYVFICNDQPHFSLSRWVNSQ